jgi:hypothetical protein
VATPDLALEPALHDSLGLLLEAVERACELGRTAWEFAVEIDCLRATGLTNTELRVLISVGLVEHSVEQTEPAGGGRRFVGVSNLSLPANTCLVLTERGIAYARAHVGQRDDRPPAAGQAADLVWDTQRRELRVGPRVVKRFLQPAPDQQTVLSAFEEERWPPRIDDPLPPRHGLDPARRLHRTASNLNRSQVNRLIHFGAGGDGRSFRWEWARGDRAGIERG